MKNNKFLKEIGLNIQTARLKEGLTQEELAEKCNVSVKYISSIETGKSSGSTSLIIDICNVLKISPNYVFGKAVKYSTNSIDVLPTEISLTYLKLKDDNKSFINHSITHLYSMQKKR